MRLEDSGSYVCAHCGVAVNLAADETARVTIFAASGRPNVRVVSIGGNEVHRCEISSAP
jgi:hypothetical protein